MKLYIDVALTYNHKHHNSDKTEAILNFYRQYEIDLRSHMKHRLYINIFWIESETTVRCEVHGTLTWYFLGNLIEEILKELPNNEWLKPYTECITEIRVSRQ